MPDTVSDAIMPLRLAIVNARVWTGVAARPWADAVLVDDGRLVAVGSSAALRKLAGTSAHVIDAGRRLLVPATRGAAIVTGALADLALVDDLLSLQPPLELDEREVVLAVSAGRVVHDRVSSLA